MQNQKREVNQKMNLQIKKNSLEKIHADIVLSIGVNCRPAHHLGCYNLRKEANPIDWMTNFNLDVTYNLFQSNFKDFFTNVSNEGIFDQHHLKIKDLKTNMISIHHFNHNDELEKQTKEFNSQSTRRYLKIKEKIINSKDIVFVYNGINNIENIITFLKSIQNLFGFEKNYYLVHIKDDKNKKWNEIEINQYEITKNIKYYQYIGNDANITNDKAKNWHGNQFLWGEAMKNISLRENEVAKEITKVITKNNGAIQIIKNHLCYKLGESAICNSKTFFGYIKMPFILYCISLAHKEKIKAQSKNSSLPLSTYDDYQEALQIKECFTYKLGKIIINASNNKWTGGGYQNVV
ncbi:papain-like cysteine peptidase [Campylobacter lari]|nr:papain-like cysteine peptidase [Campylobacter lari]